MKINSPNLAYNDGYTSNMHYVRYNTESLGIASLTSDPDPMEQIEAQTPLQCPVILSTNYPG